MKRLVKGDLFADFVRIIKSRPEVNWQKYLKPADLAYLKKPITNSEWYPLEVYERMGLALFKEFVRSDPDEVRRQARQSIDQLFGLHRALICDNDPRETLMRFQVFRRSLFNFSAIDLLILFGTHARIRIAYGMSPPAEEAACSQALGFFERLLELSGAGRIEHRFVSKAWEGAAETILELDWREEIYSRRVKGVLFLDYIKMIKSRKEVDWSKYLKPEDLAYLDQQIIETEWYPMESFERMGVGILREIAGGSLKGVRWWGSQSVEALVQMYPDLVCPGDPRESLMRFIILRRSFFDYGAFELLFIAGDYAKIGINYGMGRIAEEAACYQALGFFERLLALSGALNLRYRFSRKAWEGEETTILELHWEEGDLPGDKGRAPSKRKP